MIEQYKQPYLDSSVFVAWVRKPDEIVKGINRREIADHIFKIAEAGTFKIYTSSLTLAEVYKRRGGPKLTEEENGKLLEYFEREFIELIDVDRLIGEQANGFCRQYNLLPNDAIHLACAVRAKCDVLLAWDTRFTRVVRPDIKIEEPDIRGQTSLPKI
jgi:predicted nucleic acid-binding protein